MAVTHLLNNTAEIYRYSAGAAYPFAPVWALSSTIKIRVSSTTRREIVQDGQLVTKIAQIALVEPEASVLEEDRVYIGADVYRIDGVEDVDGMGREKYLYLDKMPDGTFGAM